MQSHYYILCHECGNEQPIDAERYEKIVQRLRAGAEGPKCRKCKSIGCTAEAKHPDIEED